MKAMVKMWSEHLKVLYWKQVVLVRSSSAMTYLKVFEMVDIAKFVLVVE
jgi:hypothetical protein